MPGYDCSNKQLHGDASPSRRPCDGMRMPLKRHAGGNPTRALGGRQTMCLHLTPRNKKKSLRSAIAPGMCVLSQAGDGAPAAGDGPRHDNTGALTSAHAVPTRPACAPGALPCLDACRLVRRLRALHGPCHLPKRTFRARWYATSPSQHRFPHARHQRFPVRPSGTGCRVPAGALRTYRAPRTGRTPRPPRTGRPPRQARAIRQVRPT